MRWTSAWTTAREKVPRGLVLDPAIAFELNPVDDRRLGDRHDDLRAGATDLNVLEQAGTDQRLVGAVDLELVEPLSRPQPEIRLNRARFDPPIALNDDLLSRGVVGSRDRTGKGADQNRAEQKRKPSCSACYADPLLHAQRAFFWLSLPPHPDHRTSGCQRSVLSQFRLPWKPHPHARYSFTVKALLLGHAPKTRRLPLRVVIPL